MKIVLDEKEANINRGIGTLISFVVVFFGSILIWGFGAGLFSIGILIYINCMIDEALERITRIKLV